jgi:hypothetical protein
MSYVQFFKSLSEARTNKFERLVSSCILDLKYTETPSLRQDKNREEMEDFFPNSRRWWFRESRFAHSQNHKYYFPF